MPYDIMPEYEFEQYRQDKPYQPDKKSLHWILGFPDEAEQPGVKTDQDYQDYRGNLMSSQLTQDIRVQSISQDTIENTQYSQA